ncbi:hypothetical protein Rmet_3152 [Cupriavidus metallidurans CH34]|uniref:Uncharacterized protein n=1 Tax=Cupriavidus metallidurans (strain ATCC 43123 / DSM 2839 / NBRC 102507 / CH34) TaxID=266264 RepID=Q1LIK2_CUPMC|nr:hypothetical protein Rmet_3152 [Cupriavidus metallidurans CH34]
MLLLGSASPRDLASLRVLSDPGGGTRRHIIIEYNRSQTISPGWECSDEAVAPQSHGETWKRRSSIRPDAGPFAVLHCPHRAPH